MEELVRPWREAYRLHDSRYFDGGLCDVPPLRREEIRLDRSTITTTTAAAAEQALLFSNLNAPATPATLFTPGASFRSRSSGLTEIPALNDSASEATAWCSSFQWREPRSTDASDSNALEAVSWNKRHVEELVADPEPLDSNIVRRSLVALLSGHESRLFRWDEKKYLFEYREEEIGNTGGLSRLALQSVFRPCMDRGKSYRRLVLALDHLTGRAPTLSSVFTKLCVFLQEFLEYCQASIPAILRNDTQCPIMSIPHWAEPTTAALAWLCEVMNLNSIKVVSANLINLSPVDLINAVKQEVELQTVVDTVKDQVARELMLRLTASLMQEISSATGLGPKMPDIDRHLLPPHVPEGSVMIENHKIRLSLLTTSQSTIISEVEHGIDFLRSYADAAVEEKLREMQCLKLEFTMFENSLVTLETRANAWAKRMKTAGRPDVSENGLFTAGTQEPRAGYVSTPKVKRTKSEMRSELANSMLSMSKVPPIHARESFKHHLESHSQAEPSFDLVHCMQICLDLPLGIQASIVHSEVSDVLVRKMNLRNHLSLLEQVFLMGNGAFSSKLRDTIFSSSKNSIGLNFTNKKAPRWPPSAAKVSTATRSLLLETIGVSFRIPTTHTLVEQELLGSLGIVMSLDTQNSELPRTSLDALSFLQFGFRPPKPLDIVITDKSLKQYSRINQFLLILMRMNHVVDQLTSESRRYRAIRRLSSIPERFVIESANFVRSFVAHIYETVISTAWQQFQGVLNQTNVSIRGLVEAHHSMLEHISNGCFVSRKMAEIQAVVREIFGSILAFSLMPADKREEDHEEVKVLFSTFDSNAREFIAALSGAEASSTTSFATGASVRFLMNDFWS